MAALADGGRMTSMVHPDGDVPGRLPEVRCACGACGAHVIAWRLRSITGHCSNCGSYDVRPLPAPGAAPARA
jgi:hypothetical protein